MQKIAIIHHASSFHITEIARSIADGISRIDSMHVMLLSTEEAANNLTMLDSVDAIIFGSPTYFGTVSAEYKQFLDITTEVWRTQRWHNKIAAAFTCGDNYAGDQLSTLIQLSIFAMQNGMIWVGHDLMPPKYTQPHAPSNSSGAWLGLTCCVGHYDNPDMQANEIAAYAHFGQRIATIVKHFANLP
jgi:NAD(P)H dehydrogenase (quinone)